MKTATMKQSKNTSPIVAALFSLLPHTICCGIPLALIFMGLGGLSTASFFSKYHGLFTIFGTIALVYGVVAYWRNHRKQSCGCHSCNKTSQRCAFCLLCLAALIQIGMFTFMWRAASAAPSEKDIVMATQENKLAFQLTGLHCPGCAAEMEIKVMEITGIKSADLDLSKNLLTIETTSNDAKPELLAETFQALGYCKVQHITKENKEGSNEAESRP